MKEEMQKRISQDTQEFLMTPLGLSCTFFASLKELLKILHETSLLKGECCVVGCSLNTCQVPFTISVFPSTTIGNVV